LFFAKSKLSFISRRLLQFGDIPDRDKED